MKRLLLLFLLAASSAGAQSVQVGGGLGGGSSQGFFSLASKETNWWAVFEIADPEGMKTNGFPYFTDVALMCWTNGPTHGINASSYCFYYTTSNALLNAIPAQERFTTNWYPRAFYCQVHASHDVTWLQEWKSIMPTYSGSIEAATAAWDGASSASNPFRWVIMVRETSEWFHPTNNLSWAYMMEHSTKVNKVYARDGVTLLNNQVWNKIVPAWYTTDPRPKVFRSFNNVTATTWVMEAQHQQP